MEYRIHTPVQENSSCGAWVIPLAPAPSHMEPSEETLKGPTTILTDDRKLVDDV